MPNGGITTLPEFPMQIKQISGLVTAFLMTEKGLRVLEHVATCYPGVIGQVVVAGDQGVLQDYREEIMGCCARYGIPCVSRETFTVIETEYAMAVSWRWLIAHPKDRLVVFHDSLLPGYRGFAPLVNALINGEMVIGVTALLGGDEYDAGEIVAQSSVNVQYPIKIRDAIQLLNKNYTELIDAVLGRLASGHPLESKAQDEAGASYSVWRDEQDYCIDWARSAAEIKRFIDAVGYPYRGALTFWEGRPVRVHDASVLPDVRIENRDCGKVLFMKEGRPVVICGSGLLRLDHATIEGESGTASLFPLEKFRIRFSMTRAPFVAGSLGGRA